VRLLADLPRQSWILPVLLVTVWLLLWFVPVRSRTRMWYAGMAPVVSAVGIVLGLIIMFSGGRDAPDDPCAGPQSCGAAHWGYALASIPFVGLAILANALAAAVISLPLLVITAAVELPRMAAGRTGPPEGSCGPRR
jgi:hypothetical protein